MESIFLSTERLILRPTSYQDSDFLYTLMNSPKYLEFIGDRNINSPEDAGMYVNIRIEAMYKEHGYSSFTVIRKTDKKKVGTVGDYAHFASLQLLLQSVLRVVTL